jgi:hypothetical protein
MSFRSSPLWLVLLTACGSSTTLTSTPEADASTPLDAGVGDSSDAGIDTSIESTDAAGDTSIVADTAPACAPANAPSSQNVEIVVTNSGTADRYLVTAGTWCDPYSISSSQKAALFLNLGFQCVCECPNPGAPGPSTLHRLAPGESFSLTWDARALTTCTESIDCATMGWPGLGTAHELIGGKTPALPGLYWVSVGALTALPHGCAGDGTTFGCQANVGGNPSGTTPSAIQTSCPAEVSASASFTLPTSGDVSVAIALTN